MTKLDDEGKMVMIKEGATYETSTRRKLRVSKTYEFSDLKRSYKMYDSTFNEYMVGVILKSVHEYSEGKEPNPFLVQFVASVRDPMQKPEDFEPKNEFVSFVGFFDLSDDLKTNLKSVKEELSLITKQGFLKDTNKQRIL